MRIMLTELFFLVCLSFVRTIIRKMWVCVVGHYNKFDIYATFDRQIVSLSGSCFSVFFLSRSFPALFSYLALIQFGLVIDRDVIVWLCVFDLC